MGMEMEGEKMKEEEEEENNGGFHPQIWCWEGEKWGRDLKMN